MKDQRKRNMTKLMQIFDRFILNEIFFCDFVQKEVQCLFYIIRVERERERGHLP